MNNWLVYRDLHFLATVTYLVHNMPLSFTDIFRTVVSRPQINSMNSNYIDCRSLEHHINFMKVLYIPATVKRTLVYFTLSLVIGPKQTMRRIVTGNLVTRRLGGWCLKVPLGCRLLLITSMTGLFVIYRPPSYS